MGDVTPPSSQNRVILSLSPWSYPNIFSHDSSHQGKEVKQSREKGKKKKERKKRDRATTNTVRPPSTRDKAPEETKGKLAVPYLEKCVGWVTLF